jgi:tetratricopeptide (TPR) repeat protein
MKRITILLVLAALLAVPAGALSVKKKSIRKVAVNNTKLVAPTVYQQAIDAYENNDFNTAASLINKHLEKNPNHADGWAYKAAILSEMDDPDAALKAIDKAKSLSDKNDAELMNWLYFTRSMINLQLNDTISALGDLDMAVHYDEKDVDSYFRRANIYKRMHRYDEALVNYGLVVQYERDAIDGYLGIGTVSGSLKQRKQAIKAFTKAIELDPDDAESYALRAVEYYNDWDYEKSAKDVINALERDKDNQRAMWVLQYLKQDAAKEVLKVFKDKAKKSKDESWLDILNKEW